MKKNLFIVSSLLGTALMFTALGYKNMKQQSAKAFEIIDSDGFDENNIALSFFSTSDSHIGYGSDDVLLHNALKTVKENLDIDLVTSCGDITQSGQKEDVESLMNIYSTYYNNDEVPFVIALGNHDTHWAECMNPSGFYDAFGSDFYKNDISTEADARQGNRHIIVKGYHFICIEMSAYGPGSNTISGATETWLKNQLDSVVKENPNQYVFVLSHSPAKGTIVGSKSSDLSGDWGASEQLYKIFSKYPQVVNLSGHTHYVNQTDNFISSKGGFISIGVPSLSDFAYNDIGDETWGGSNLGVGVANPRSYSFGQFIQIDNQGNIKLTRYDFKNNDFVKKPIVIPKPTSDLNHINVMSDEYRIAHNQAPYYDGDDTITAFFNSETDIDIKYPSFKDDDSVFYYQIVIKNEFGMQLKKIIQASPFHLYPNPDNIPVTLTYNLKNLKLDGKFSISVYAVDQWEAASEPLTVNIERNIQQDKAKASALAERIDILVLMGELDEDMIEEVQSIRREYDSYDYLIRQYVTNYDAFVRIETKFYNTYYLSDDVYKYPLDIAKVYSNAPIPSRGRFVEGEFGGVSMIWDSAITGNSIGINRGYFLDTLHLSFTNMYLDSEDKSIGFILDNDVQVNYEQGKNLMFFVDFITGSVNVVQGDVNIQIGRSPLLQYTSLNHTPWQMRFDKVDNGYNITFITMTGTYTCLLNSSYLENLSSYTNVDNTFVEITPVGNHMSMKLDVLAIHHGGCFNKALEDRKAEALEEIQTYYEKIDMNKYSSNNQEKIRQYYQNAQDKINASLTEQDIEKAVKEFKNNVYMLPIKSKDDKDDQNKGGCKGEIISTFAITGLISAIGLVLTSLKKKVDK